MLQVEGRAEQRGDTDQHFRKSRNEAIFKIKKILSVIYAILFLPIGNYKLDKLSFFPSCYNILLSASKIPKSTVMPYRLTPEVIFYKQ